MPEFCKLSGFCSSDGIESRAACLFALIALAGEKATEYGLTGWQENESLEAAIELFNKWRDFRGQGQTEMRQILQGIRYFIDRHGDSRFSGIDQKANVYEGDSIDQRPVVRDRAGYWKILMEDVFSYLIPSALQEAATGFDLKIILQTLNDAQWIIEKITGKILKKVKVEGADSFIVLDFSQRGGLIMSVLNLLASMELISSSSVLPKATPREPWKYRWNMQVPWFPEFPR